MSKHLLLVDDDQELSELLAEYLRNEGYQISQAYSGEQALEKLQQPEQFDLLVLDIMMPGISGLELLQQIRPRVTLPVVMLTGRGDDIDRILGLEMGADDYLGKPCNPRELLARIRAVLRRTQQPEAAPREKSQLLELHGISYDPGQRRVQINGAELSLTSAEFNVLGQLMEHSGQVVSKSLLTENVLHRKLTAYDRSIDVHVSRVRQKLSKQLPDKELIKTVRGEGYMMIREG